MYCPTCGTKLVQALSYCNHCGANLPKSRDEARRTDSINTLLWVIVGTTITILGMGLGALVLMKDGGIDPTLGKVFVMLTFVAFVVVEGALVWRLLNLQKLSKEKPTLQQRSDSDRGEVNEARTRALGDPGEPVPTAAEQITRNFEPAYKEHKQP